MRFGALEIGIVIVVMLIIFAVTRMRLLGNGTADTDKPPRRRTARNNEGAKQVRRSRIQILGAIFVLAGILILLSNISLARWVALAPIWAIIIAAIGLATIFVVRRR